jgi:hypothetical protein
MPVSKKRKFKDNPFKNTWGYKRNSHRNKLGETQKQVKEKNQSLQNNREPISDIYTYLRGVLK